MNFSDEIEKATKEISTNHNKIIDDWCKVYMAQRYKEGMSIDVGSFTLCQQNLSLAQNEIGFKYWFEDGKPEIRNEMTMWFNVSDIHLDDGDYLVAWKDYDGKYSSPIKAYWVSEEQAFFPICGMIAFPLKVDIFMKIPELPE